MVWSQYSILNIVIHWAQTPKYKNCLCCSSARILSWSLSISSFLHSKIKLDVQYLYILTSFPHFKTLNRSFYSSLHNLNFSDSYIFWIWYLEVFNSVWEGGSAADSEMIAFNPIDFTMGLIFPRSEVTQNFICLRSMGSQDPKKISFFNWYCLVRSPSTIM